MEKEIIEKIEKQIKEKKQTYITLEEIKTIIGTEEPYTEMFNIIKQFINDGILKSIRKKQEWKNSITFFKIQNYKRRNTTKQLY